MSQAEQTGPIIVSHPVAQRQLREDGELITYRASERTTGETWWRESRTGEKQGDVRVEKVYPVVARGKAKGLNHYVQDSGFESVEAWQAAIRELNDGIPEIGYLYRVELLEGDDGE